METLVEQMPKTEGGFIQHMTKFDDDTKSDLMNVVQYSLMSIIPIVVVNKIIGRFVPEADENKGSLEITAEVVGQLVVLLVSLYFINRLVTYVKPYSGAGYGELNMITLSLVLLVVVFSFQTQLAEKVEILYGRVIELWTGEPYGVSASGEEPQQETRVRVTQPLGPSMPTHQPSRADYLGAHNQMVGGDGPSVSMANARYESTLISDLPQEQPQMQQPNSQGPIQPLPQPNFDSMYQEPMAANEGFGGFSAF